MENDTDILKYCSNIDKNVYSIKNLPEEVIAVIFAYVSRSPRGFRENILKVLEEDDFGEGRASKFHDKWVLNYGHSSVAELATLHLGIEKVSRLFSAELELSNEFLSFCEYSQRYQQPKRGDYYIPSELDRDPVMKDRYNQFQNYIFDCYEKINVELFDKLQNEIFPKDTNADPKAHLEYLKKKAFEDSRYVLTLATYTNLGMTGNARAFEDSLSKLLSSSYQEVRDVAEQMKKEATNSCPTLVKYAKENPYHVSLEKLNGEGLMLHSYGRGKDVVKIIDYTGFGHEDPHKYAIDKMFFQFFRKHYSSFSGGFGTVSQEAKYEFIKRITQELGVYDMPSDIFKLVDYEVDFLISEACWHQFLRHRQINWYYGSPTCNLGITVPPSMITDYMNGTSIYLEEPSNKSKDFRSELLNSGFNQSANYVVLNAHRRSVGAKFTLWELYHLINLRMSEHAQWDIKNVVTELADKLLEIHPLLIEPALDRLQVKYSHK